MEADEARKRLFAQRLQGKKEKDEIRTTIQPRPQEKPLRLAPSQLRIWTLQETEPKSPLFNIVNSHWYTGTLDLIALEEAVKRVIERHPILFATFSPEEEGIMIIPGRATDFNLENYTLTKEEALTKAKKESHRFFNLRKEKPLRLLVYQTSDSERSLLQLITHHLVFDEWSLGLFWKEISLFYAGETSTAPHLAINYYDYAHWQSEHIQSPIYQSQLEAWTHRLKDPPPPLELPGDLAEEPSISSKGKKCKLSLNPELCGALRKLTNTQGTSLSNCLLAAYKVFLFHLTQESNFAVGSPIANRKYAELSPLIGFFLSTVALRTTLQGDLPFQDFLARVHDTMQHALKNQDVLFDDLVRALNPVRQSGRHPLFSTMFVFEGELESRPQIELSNHEFELISLHPNVAKVDLCLFAIEQKESLDLLFEYRSDKFSSELIEGWLHNFVSLLEAITRNPQQSLVRLNLLTKSEQNDLQPPPPLSSVPTSVLEPISQIVKTHPQKLALSGDKALTYLELWEQSGRLAAEIQRSGIHKGVIALLITREINAIIAILGILRSGNAYLPLDPVTPPERLANLLELASAEAVVSQGQPPKNLSETLPYFDLTQRFEEEILPESPQPEDLAYLIFTSGSTGTPKAVPITHRNLTHSTQARLEYYSSPPKRFLLLSPLHFDSSVAGIFWTLTAGGTLLPLPSGMEHDPTKLVDFVQKHKITHSLGLPSLIQIILESSDPDNLVSLRTLIAAGESCSTTLAQLHHEKIPEGKLFNEYGPTEATVWATVHEVSPDESPIPIGQSIPGLKAFSLNAAGLPTPTGMIGELALAGPTLSPGYLEQLDLTKKKFITLDIQSQPTRVYRTGDLVRKTPSGEFVYLGRSDHQLKVRGFRIEPREIESNLLNHPNVQEALIGADSQLRAFVVLKKPMEATELTTFLARKLPAYMIPDTISTVESLSTLPNGKIDRTTLPKLLATTPKVREHIQPKNEVETKLAQIWQICLGGRRPSTDDHFFEAGGDSLLALRFISLARKENINIAAGDLSHYPTIAKLANSIEKERQHILPLSEKSEGNHTPKEILYCFPILNGRLDLYLALAKKTPELSLFGLQPLGIDGKTPVFSGMETLSDFYVDLIRQHSSGPYRLLGFCSAAPFIYETARKLQEQGEEIIYTALVDATFPRSEVITPKKFRKLKALKRQFRANGSTLQGLYTTFCGSFKFRLKKWFPSQFPEETQDERIREINKASMEAIEKFQIQETHFPILFFQTWTYKAWDEVYLEKPMREYWNQSTSDFHLHFLPCKHDECFQGEAGEELARFLTNR